MTLPKLVVNYKRGEPDDRDVLCLGSDGG